MTHTKAHGRCVLVCLEWLRIAAVVVMRAGAAGKSPQVTSAHTINHQAAADSHFPFVCHGPGRMACCSLAVGWTTTDDTVLLGLLVAVGLLLPLLRVLHRQPMAEARACRLSDVPLVQCMPPVCAMLHRFHFNYISVPVRARRHCCRRLSKPQARASAACRGSVTGSFSCRPLSPVPCSSSPKRPSCSSITITVRSTARLTD